MGDDSTLPDDPEIAGKVIDAKSRERGFLGRVFGTREHAPTNIAALALVVVAVLLILAIFVPLQEGVDRTWLVSTLMSAFMFVVGVMFGRKID